MLQDAMTPDVMLYRCDNCVRTTGIDSRDCVSKKQLFDLLTSLCVHSRTGHQQVVGAFHQYKANSRNIYSYLPRSTQFVSHTYENTSLLSLSD